MNDFLSNNKHYSKDIIDQYNYITHQLKHSEPNKREEAKHKLLALKAKIKKRIRQIDEQLENLK